MKVQVLKLKCVNLGSKETFFTRQQKNVTCQINTDTNLYYTTTIPEITGKTKFVTGKKKCKRESLVYFIKV
jgi:ribosomal protein S27E